MRDAGGSAIDSSTTVLLGAAVSGNEEARSELIVRIDSELCHLASVRSPVANPVDLLHEVYIHLLDRIRIDARERAHFYAAAAPIVRRIAVDAARKAANAPTRPFRTTDGVLSLSRNEDVLAVDEALIELARLDAAQARILELRLFGDLHHGDIALALDLPTAVVEEEWAMVRA